MESHSPVMDEEANDGRHHCGTRCRPARWSYFSMALVLQRLRPVAVPCVPAVVGALLTAGQDFCANV